MTNESAPHQDGYEAVLADLGSVIQEARNSAARTINAVMTAAYWLIGRRIVEGDQGGQERAVYGDKLLVRLADDLGQRFGRGFLRQNLQQMRQFYLACSASEICLTASGESRTNGGESSRPTASGKSAILPAASALRPLADCFPLPWSAYVRLLSVKSENARRFYESEALRGGWSVRQLRRQIESQFYERTALSKDKAAMLEQGQELLPEDAVSPREAIKDPFVLEFLDLKDEYPSTLHLWWARRPLASSRAVLIALLLPDPCGAFNPETLGQGAWQPLPFVQGQVRHDSVNGAAMTRSMRAREHPSGYGGEE